MKMRFITSIFFCCINLWSIAQCISVSNSTFYQINNDSISQISGGQNYYINKNPISSYSDTTKFIINSTISAFSIPVYYNIASESEFVAISLNSFFSLKRTEQNNQFVNVNINKSSTLFHFPEAKKTNDETYVLIIGNEDYASFQTGLNKEQNVEFAMNDAKIFKDLCRLTLGIPEENIVYIENAGFVKMKQAIAQLNLIAKHSSGKATLIFYYAGHGLPDEREKTPYLIPVDVAGTSFDFAISLPSIYQSLTEYPSEKVIVFLDACFTGGARNSSLVSTRAVRVRPKQEANYGNNLVVFSSSNSEQSSLPYKEKNHGLFTYYLISKFIESKGTVKLGELDEYLRSKVALTSILINKTEQIPTVIYSPNVSEKWKDWSLNK